MDQFRLWHCSRKTTSIHVQCLAVSQSFDFIVFLSCSTYCLDAPTRFYGIPYTALHWPALDIARFLYKFIWLIQHHSYPARQLNTQLCYMSCNQFC